MEPTHQLLNRMHQQADHWEAQNDFRFIFLRCYAIMSGNMIRALDGDRFQEPEWVNALLHRFAAYYFEALQQYDNGEEMVPAVWQQVHSVCVRQDLHVMQYLLLGVNAHINYDLVLALYDQLGEEWNRLDDAQREMRKQDHERVNDIIAETIDIVQDQVVKRQAPFMAVVDQLMGRVDEWILRELISGWRNEVWNVSCRMLSAEDAEAREIIRRELEQSVMQKAKKLLAY